MQVTVFAVVIGFILDLILGDPYWLCAKIGHPIITIGKLISLLEKVIRQIFPNNKLSLRIAGGLLVFLVISITSCVSFIILQLIYAINMILGFLLETFLCYQIFAVKSLKDESMKVYLADNLVDKRLKLSYIVGRDTTHLDETGVIKATVETIAENTTDGVIAPMIFMLIGGAPLGLMYKAINTLDSMIGYKNEKYKYFGTIGARLDDLANFIPARITAILMLISSMILKFNTKNGFKIFLRDRFNHKSPNSAQTESVMAGMLGIQLAGNAYYFGELYEKPTIGDMIRPVEMEDIKIANAVLYTTSILGMIILTAIKLFIQII